MRNIISDSKSYTDDTMVSDSVIKKALNVALKSGANVICDHTGNEVLVTLNGKPHKALTRLEWEAGGARWGLRILSQYGAPVSAGAELASRRI
jgi:hypothetical protein